MGGAWEGYQGVPEEAMKRRVENAQSGKRYSSNYGKGYLVGDDVMKAFVPRDGGNIIRIVPPPEYAELEYFGLDVRFHREVGFRKDMYICLKHMVLGACPVCEQQTEELWDSDPELAKSYFPDHRVLLFVLDLHEDNAKKDELLRWSCPITLADEIAAQAKDPETGRFIDLCHPKEAPCVYFTRSGKGRKTKYSQVKVGSKAYPLSDKIAKQLISIYDLLIIPTPEEVAASMGTKTHANEDIPVDAYEEDAAGGGKYGAAAEPEPEPEVEEPEPEPEAEEEAEPEQESDLLDAMDRDELKRFKVKHKADVEGLQFVIYKNTPDDEIRELMRQAFAEANRLDLIKEQPATKPTQTAAKENPMASGGGRDDEVAAKRESVRAKLKAKLEGKK